MSQHFSEQLCKIILNEQIIIQDIIVDFVTLKILLTNFVLICFLALMPKHTNGIHIFKNQLIGLLEKKIIYTYRRWLMTLIFVSCLFTKK